MKAKLSDVAARAGVSLTTVSRVINHDETLRISKAVSYTHLYL